MKYLKRVIGLPFFLMLNIIGMIFHLFTLTKFFMLYGGEAIAYDNKNTPKMIANIYDELVNQKVKSLITPEQEKQIFIDYVNEFAWEFAQLWNTELTHDQKMERIGEKFKIPEEFFNDWFKN